MKRITSRQVAAALLILTMLAGLCGCGSNAQKETESPVKQEIPVTTPETEEPEAADAALDSLRNVIRDQYCGMAVAYLGWFDGGYDDLEEFFLEIGAVENFPFLEDLPEERFVQCGGEELYLIVPGEADAQVSVRDWVMNEDNGYYGEVGAQTFYESGSGEPFLLTCNVSDITPNVVVYVDVGVEDYLLEYNPALSLMDGSLSVPGVFEPGYGVLDISVYGEQEWGYAPDTTDLNSIRSYMMDMEELCGVAFLGWFGSDWEYLADYLVMGGYTVQYPFLENITEAQFACGEGSELYLIVPRDENASVTVNQIGSNGEIERVLYRSESGEPILIQGNIGTFEGENPTFNLELQIVEKDGDSLTCFPGRDFGAMGVLEPTPVLDLIMAPVSLMESVGDIVLVGQWSGYVLPEDGRDSYEVNFAFYEDGSMEYADGPYSENQYGLDTYYRGTWERVELSGPEYPASGYVFDLLLDPVETGGWGNAPRTLKTTQYVTMVYDQLAIQLIEGDSICPNNWEYQILLVPAFG